MNDSPPGGRPLRLAWVSPITPAKLDSVTWLDTTRELRRLGMDAVSYTHLTLPTSDLV